METPTDPVLQERPTEEVPPQDEPPQQRRSRRLVWILAVLALLSTGVAAYASSRGPTSDSAEVETVRGLIHGSGRPADIAPSFRVPTLDGGSFSLADHFADGGGPVFLNLWASWCPPCRAEMPTIDAAADRHPDVKFIGVAVQDDYVAATRFAEEIGVAYTIGLDEKGEVNALYPSVGLPATFLISADGTVAQALIGQLDESRIEMSLAMWLGE